MICSEKWDKSSTVVTAKERSVISFSVSRSLKTYINCYTKITHLHFEVSASQNAILGHDIEFCVHVPTYTAILERVVNADYRTFQQTELTSPKPG